MFVRPYRRRIALALGALLVGSGINLLFPEVIRRALHPETFPFVLENLRLFFGLLAALFVVQGGAFFLRSLLFGLLGQQVYADVRERMFRSVVGKEIAFFDHHRSGDLASRLNSDAALVQDLVSAKLSVILRYGVQVLFGTVLMAWMSWRMTFAIVASVVCMVVVSGVFVRSLRAASRHFQTALATLTSFAAETFAGAKVVRALGAESTVRMSFVRKSTEVLEAGQGRVRISAAFSSGASLLLNVLLLGVVWYGVSLVATESLPISDLAAFALYGSIVAISFAFLVSAYAEVVQSLGGLDRVFELFETEDVRDEVLTEIISYSGPSLSFHEVSFSYPERSTATVLDNLSLQVAGGTVVGMMGPSGAGKSTIVQLLLKFYPVSSGTIQLNDYDLNAVSNQELRSKVAWVPQEPLLFGTSIYENLTLGNPTLSREDVERKLNEWGFLDFVTELPGGLSMVLGEHGTQLSGGQRQRIAIARALLKNPTVLLLDEATSGLDSHLEDKVLSAVRGALPTSTIVIVSHRLSSVRGADTIFMIHEGRVVEQGCHEELKNASGLYSHYALRQAIA
jgi:ABC-type multidrug transport system fused ATPase/permease subunit